MDAAKTRHNRRRGESPPVVEWGFPEVQLTQWHTIHKLGSKLLPSQQGSDVQPPAKTASKGFRMPFQMETIYARKCVAKRPPGKPIWSPPFAKYGKWFPSWRSRQFHLSPDEGCTFQLIAFLKPIGEHQSRGIIIRIFADGREENIIFGHGDILHELAKSYDLPTHLPVQIARSNERVHHGCVK
jgi:hypothetical protein